MVAQKVVGRFDSRLDPTPTSYEKKLGKTKQQMIHLTAPLEHDDFIKINFLLVLRPTILTICISQNLLEKWMAADCRLPILSSAKPFGWVSGKELKNGERLIQKSIISGKKLKNRKRLIRRCGFE
jgi:hypothetical protein